MARTRIPEDVLSAAHARSQARAGGDWTEADRLRGEIEAAGWKVVDRGTDFALTPAAPPDVAEGDRVRYGASRNVPSRLEEPATGLATVVMLVTDAVDAARLTRLLEGLRSSLPDAVSMVIVADEPSDEVAAVLASWPAGAAEIVWTSDRLGVATAWNMGVRRASAPVVVLLDEHVEPTGDIATPLVRALDDPTVAVAGGWGLRSADLRAFEAAPAGDDDVDIVTVDLQAFRRADYAARGPLDERFGPGPYLEAWWSLLLREAEAGREEGSAARRAVRVAVPATRHARSAVEPTGSASAGDVAVADARDRTRKRDFYRVIERFGARSDLLTPGDRPPGD